MAKCIITLEDGHGNSDEIGINVRFDPKLKDGPVNKGELTNAQQLGLEFFQGIAGDREKEKGVPETDFGNIEEDAGGQEKGKG